MKSFDSLIDLNHNGWKRRLSANKLNLSWFLAQTYLKYSA